MPKQEAQILNIMENVHREDPPLWDLCYRVSELVGDGVEGRLIAKQLKSSPGGVSQMKKIHDFPAKFKSQIAESMQGGELDAEIAAAAQTAVDIFIERLSMISKHPCSIGLSHAREFTGSVLHKKEPLKIKPAIDLLFQLTGCGEGLKFDPKVPPIEWSIFQARLRAAKVQSQFSESAVAPADAPTETLAAPDLSFDTVSVADLAEQQETLQADVQVPEEEAPVSTGKDEEAEAAIAADNASAVEAGEATEAGAEEPTDEDALPSEDDLAEMTMTSTDEELMEDELAGDDEVIDLGEAGEMKMGAVDVEEQTWRPKQPEKIYQQARSYIEAATSEYDEQNTVIDATANALAAVTCFEIIGDENLEPANESYAVMIESANAWLQQILEALKEANAESYAAVMSDQPEFIAPEFE
jgi:hypothetical protein